MNKPDKGEKNGSCNRQACQKPGAVYFNHSTKRYYCEGCATLINNMNDDWAPGEYGHQLCTLDSSQAKTDGQKLVEFCDRIMGCVP